MLSDRIRVMDQATEQYHREVGSPKSVRYLGYSLLGNVSCCGEPVVPRILGEEANELGSFFKVEELSGVDLSDFLHLPIDVNDKLRVIQHIVHQLEAIDQAGFVIFDRHGGNIRVVNWNGKASTRQVDVEDMYDKNKDQVLSSDSAANYRDMINQLKMKGIDLWTPTVNILAGMTIKAIGSEKGIGAVLQPFKRLSTTPTQQGVLQQFDKTIGQIIQ